MVALLPVQNTSDETLSWDVSRWPPLQQTGLTINHYCVQALGMPGAVGTGGIDPACEVSTALMIRDLSHSIAFKVLVVSFASFFTSQNPNSTTTPWMIIKMAALLQYTRVAGSLVDQTPPTRMTLMFQGHPGVLQLEGWAS